MNDIFAELDKIQTSTDGNETVAATPTDGKTGFATSSRGTALKLAPLTAEATEPILRTHGDGSVSVHYRCVLCGREMRAEESIARGTGGRCWEEIVETGMVTPDEVAARYSRQIERGAEMLTAVAATAKVA